MSKKLYRAAAVLAAVIGAMAVFAGGNVLLGATPDYTVIGWLPAYNFAAGLVSLFVLAPLLWHQSALALLLAAVILGVHSIVLAILLAGYRGVVAPDSLAAMTLRISVGLIILGLLAVAQWTNRLTAA